MKSRLIAASVLMCCAVFAQQPAAQNPPSTTLRVSTRLVQVDVVAVNKDGSPVPDLGQNDFTVLENGKKQSIASFGYEHHAGNPISRSLPAGVFTNREIGAENANVTILLLDALNTPFLDQAYARNQMLKYLESQQGNGQFAVFALANDLLLLQNFTSDPKLLQKAIAKQPIQQSMLLADADAEQTQLPSAPEQVIANLQQFQDEEIAARTDVRVRVTLAAMEQIARSVAGIPGRKTLVWVSGAFPIDLQPERTGYFSTERWYSSEIARASTLLNEAQVSVYPVDARGLAVSSTSSASFTGLNSRGELMTGAEFSRTLNRRNAQFASTQYSMEQIAQDTGGQAFYNRNDIDHAVALAVADGSGYYHLTYYPTDKKWDGNYRKIEVKSSHPGIHLRYRRGYFASDPWHARTEDDKHVHDEINGALMEPLLSTELTFFGAAAGIAVNAKTNSSPAADSNQEIMVQFLMGINNLAFEPLDGGIEHCSLQFHVAAFSGKRMVTEKSKILECKLKPETYAMLQKKGLGYEFTIQVPAGNYRLRLLVRDSLTGHLGTLDVPYLQAKSAAQKPH